MTTLEAEEMMDVFALKCKTDNDPYFIIHFSKSDDYFKGDHNNMDWLDAIIIIKQLVKDFSINKQILIESL